MSTTMRRGGVAAIMAEDNLGAAASVESDDIYGLAFWLAYAANLTLVCANSLTFRFAEFIAWLHGPGAIGTETLTGEIVRAGLIAAVIARFWLGEAIDRRGARQVWLGSGVLYFASAVSFLACANLPAMVWACRIGYAIGLAGMFSCSVVHIQNQVPPHRRTEVIGSLGSSGFLGTILGTQLGDLMLYFLAPSRAPDHWRFVALFGSVGVLALVNLVIMLRLTRDDVHLPPHEAHPAWRLLLRHWPGPILLVAMAMGSGFVVTTVFLTRFATALSLSGIGTFFLCYSITAFSCRWLFRKWGTTAGRHKMILWGLAGMTVGHWLFIPMTFVPGSLASLVPSDHWSHGCCRCSRPNGCSSCRRLRRGSGMHCSFRRLSRWARGGSRWGTAGRERRWCWGSWKSGRRSLPPCWGF